MKILPVCIFMIAVHAVSTRSQINSTRLQGRVYQSTRIVGGLDAAPCQLKYQVSLRFASYVEPFCGGSIIDNEWVLTAAHCTFSLSPQDLTVVTGEHIVSAVDGTEQTLGVSEILIHEQYEDGTHGYDISLLKLSSPIEFDNCSQAISLPKMNHSASGQCVVSGWGHLSYGGEPSDTLQAVTLPIVPYSDCQDIYGDELDSSMLCAGLLTGGKDSCQGDSGGPLACDDTGETYLAGIVSWGNGCALAGYPGVYQETSKYIDWIEERKNNGMSIPRPYPLLPFIFSVVICHRLFMKCGILPVK